jgi:hypothetical protein
MEFILFYADLLLLLLLLLLYVYDCNKHTDFNPLLLLYVSVVFEYNSTFHEYYRITNITELHVSVLLHNFQALVLRRHFFYP